MSSTILYLVFSPEICPFGKTALASDPAIVVWVLGQLFLFYDKTPGQSYLPHIFPVHGFDLI